MSDKTREILTDDDVPPPPHRPNPKVAVVVAGAALAVTIGLTILVIPYARQAAKMQAAETAEHALKQAAKSVEGPEAPLTFREKLAALKNATATAGQGEVDRGVELGEQDRDQDQDQDQEQGEPVSAWLGFQALGIATAIVGVSAGLGVWGAAKWLGVNSMEEFAAKMRGSLEETYPELIQQVRREGDEAPIDAPNLWTRHGELNEPKFDDWIRGLEAEEAAGAASLAAQASTRGDGGKQDSRVLAELARHRDDGGDVRLV
ncbi:hypothetical protein CspeluHIS016_0800620 [Cutaneotrichosporon spelunceum]|uniref:Uncharacterized protein n=1 Tax=Cutaneotrichosporon spelunceum TaxID=1672016 RepID=A0AAD3TYY6_9TREE|nr:hypothetical protein CspeluHIS016_0800620 [Cutaneotrichosporon spelunceum]